MLNLYCYNYIAIYIYIYIYFKSLILIFPIALQKSKIIPLFKEDDRYKPENIDPFHYYPNSQNYLKINKSYKFDIFKQV